MDKTLTVTITGDSHEEKILLAANLYLLFRKLGTVPDLDAEIRPEILKAGADDWTAAAELAKLVGDGTKVKLQLYGGVIELKGNSIHIKG